MATSARPPSLGAAEAAQEAWLRDLQANLADAPGVLGARLLGSTARGEAAGLWWRGSWQGLSDLEVLVVTRGRLRGAVRRALRTRLADVVASWGQESPQFHLDLLFRERHRLRSLPPFVFTFEAREAGRRLVGPDFGPEIRRVTLANLDLRNTREILFKRLWHLAEALPSTLGAPVERSAFEVAALRVALERQALDLPTAILPDAGRLIAGFGARVASWTADPPGADVRIGAWLGRPAASYLAGCLDARQGGALDAGPWEGAYAAALAALAGGLDHLRVADGGPGADAGVASPRFAGDPLTLLPDLPGALARLAEAWPALGPRLFNEGAATPGEGLAILRQAVRIANRSGAIAGLRWLRRPRKGLLTAGLLQLHAAGQALIDGDAGQAGPALDAAERCLALVHADGPAAVPGLSEPRREPELLVLRWRDLRRQAGRAFWRVARLGDSAAWSVIETRLR